MVSVACRSGVCWAGIFFVGLVLTVGCGGSGGGAVAVKSGPIADKLIGTWEARRGFTEKISIEFARDNTAKVTTTKDNKSNTMISGWYVQEDGAKEIKIQIQAGKNNEYEARTVKWLDAHSFELKRGGAPLGRFVKM
jgi:hypothetical protein